MCHDNRTVGLFTLWLGDFHALLARSKCDSALACWSLARRSFQHMPYSRHRHQAHRPCRSTKTSRQVLRRNVIGLESAKKKTRIELVRCSDTETCFVWSVNFVRQFQQVVSFSELPFFGHIHSRLLQSSLDLIMTTTSQVDV